MGIASAISSNDQVGLFSERAASVVRDTITEEFHTLKQQVSTLEMALQQQLVTQRADLAGDAAGSASSVRSVIASLESQLELRLTTMHEMDAEVLRCCSDCNARCERVESMLKCASKLTNIQSLDKDRQEEDIDLPGLCRWTHSSI